MGRTKRSQAQDCWRSRVGLAVWGGLCVLVGGVLLLDSVEAIQLGDPHRYSAGRAVDGRANTRWSSAFKDPQWIAIDLGETREIARVKLTWEEAYATTYEVQVSNDGKSYRTVESVTEGDGGTDDLAVSAQGRYVRVYGKKRKTPYGYSLHEVEVFGPTGTLLSEGRPATASSREGGSYGGLFWSLFWPALLLGWGLPPLIAPKDGGEQAFGLVLTGIGAFLQLRALGLLTVQFSHAWPVLLIAAGLLLVVQAVRQGRSKPPVGDQPGLGPLGGL